MTDTIRELPDGLTWAQSVENLRRCRSEIMVHLWSYFS